MVPNEHARGKNQRAASVLGDVSLGAASSRPGPAAVAVWSLV